MKRNQEGKFAPAAPAKEEPFDFRESLQALYLKATRENDYAGAATLARIIRDFPDAPGDRAPQRHDLGWTTAEEFEELRALAARVKAIRAEATRRMNAGEPRPTQHLADGRWVSGARPKPAPRVSQPKPAAPIAVPAPAAKPYQLDRSRWSEVGLVEDANGNATHRLGAVVAADILSGNIPAKEAARAHQLQQQRDASG